MANKIRGKRKSAKPSPKKQGGAAELPDVPPKALAMADALAKGNPNVDRDLVARLIAKSKPDSFNEPPLHILQWRHASQIPDGLPARWEAAHAWATSLKGFLDETLQMLARGPDASASDSEEIDQRIQIVERMLERTIGMSVGTSALITLLDSVWQQSRYERDLDEASSRETTHFAYWMYRMQFPEYGKRLDPELLHQALAAWRRAEVLGDTRTSKWPITAQLVASAGIGRWKPGSLKREWKKFRAERPDIYGPSEDGEPGD